MTAEAALRERILAAIRQDYPPRRSGVLIFGRPASASTGAGHPDLFGVVLGRFIALEIKMPGGKLTPLQESRISDLRACGACAWVVRSPLDAVKAIFQTKQGVSVMPDDPMDFDDWLKGVATPAEAAPEPAIEQSATTEGEAVFEFEPTDEAPAQGQSDALDALLEPEPQPTIDEQQEARDDGLLGITSMPEPTSIQAQADADQSLAYSIEVTKAVGDRVTEVWETMQRLMLQQSTTFRLMVGLAQELVVMREQMNALLQEIDVPQAVRTVEFEVPTPLEDVLPPPPVAPSERVRRRRKAS